MSDSPDPRFALGAEFNRRRFLSAAGGVGALTLLGGSLASCTSEPSGSGTRSTAPSGGATISQEVPGPQPVAGGTYGGKLIVGTDGEPYNWGDPSKAYNPFDYDITSSMVFSGSLLNYRGSDGGPMPNIADMPEISKDGLTFDFTIRPGWKFHNGREITAEDFKYTWERLLKPDYKGSWAQSYYSRIVGYDDIVSGKVETLEGVEALDSKTLRISLAKPDFMLLNVLSMNISAPVPKEEVEKLGDAAFAKAPVGFGPFRWEKVDESSRVVYLVRNDDYYYAGLPYVDEIEFRWGIDPSLLIQQLVGEDIDVLGQGVPPDQVVRVVADPETKDMVTIEPLLGGFWAAMNYDFEPFSSKEVRQALNWAVDRDAIARLTKLPPMPSALPTSIPIDQPDGAYGYDPDRARELLASAGYADGFEFEYTMRPDEATTAQILQQQFADIGVTMTLNQVGYTAIYELQAKGDFQMTATALYLVQPTAGDLLEPAYVSGGYANYSNYSNSEVDALCRSARSDYEEESRNEMYAQASALVTDDAPSVFLSTAAVAAARGPRVQNYLYRAEHGACYDRMWLDESV